MSTRSTNTVTAIYRGDADLRREIQAVMGAADALNQTVVAKEAGISSSAFNQWLKGVYAGDNETIDTKLRIWLDSYRARIAAGTRLPQAPAYVQTPTAARVLGALSYAQIAGDIAVTYGAAGLGKTTACRHYQSQHPNVWIATITPASAGVVTSLEDICDALDITPGGGGRTMYRQICKRVMDTHGLLILDEAQHLSVAALDQVRSIHDATGIGIALVGNDGVYARMTGGRSATKLDRLFSRVGRRLSLRESTEADIRAVVQAWRVQDAKAMPMLLQIARGPGGLRALTKTLRLASMQALAEAREVGAKDIHAAARELGTVS